jgi:hypothetical protein
MEKVTKKTGHFWSLQGQRLVLCVGRTHRIAGTHVKNQVPATRIIFEIAFSIVEKMNARAFPLRQ